MHLSDVTLREGDQMPGRNYTVDEKIEAGRALDQLGIQFIQPAFPATGEKDRRVTETLANEADAQIIGLARALERDIDAAIDAGADVVETFAPVSDIQLEHLLGKSREEMLELIGEAVEYIADRGAVAHVTLADAFRADPDHILEVFERVPQVPYVNLADTVGGRTPSTVRAHLDLLAGEVDFDRVGVHFHDDLGCATANTLAAYHAGVGKADVSVASVGERAGNSSLEEVTLACAVDYGDDLGIDRSSLIPTCRTVLESIGEEWDDRKAVLGERVAEHESSIHTAAMLSDPKSLEAFDPASFGGERRLVFGSSSGTGTAHRLLERVGVEPNEERIERLMELLAANGPLELDAAVDLIRDEFDA